MMRKVTVKNVALLSTIAAFGLAACAGEDIEPPPGGDGPVAGEDYEVNRSDLAYDTAPDVSVEALLADSDAMNTFGFELLAHMNAKAVEAGGADNLLISPLSIRSAFGMLYAGTAGTGRAALASVMGFDPAGDPHAAANARYLGLMGRVGANDEGDFLDFSLANSLWGAPDFPVKASFLDTMAVNYDAGLNLLDFAADPEKARGVINGWVEHETNDLIKELFPQGSIHGGTKLALVNALYIKTTWSEQFLPEATREEDFTLADGTVVQTDTMNGEMGGYYATHAYGDDETMIVAELPTYQDSIRFGVAMAASPGAALTFDKADLDGALGGLRSELLRVSLPKFKGELSEPDIKDDLAELGLAEFFAAPDLSALTDSLKGYEIDAVVHKTVLDVREEGFEGAAATGITVGETSAPEFVEVDVDQPFVYWVRDVSSGAFIFLGTFEAPTSP
ncbi:MAG: serpin family protein [Myxococcota bacterium]